jgi:hypothetical protein
VGCHSDHLFLTTGVTVHFILYASKRQMGWVCSLACVRTAHPLFSIVTHQLIRAVTNQRGRESAFGSGNLSACICCVASQMLLHGEVKLSLCSTKHHAMKTCRGYIQKFPDWVDNEIYAYLWYYLLRSNTKGYGRRTHLTDSQNSATTAPSGRELYHM